MTVNMPVEVLCEKCLGCPDLDVNTITEENHIVEKVDDNGTIHQKDVYTSRLRCAQLERCQVLYETVFKKPEAKEEPKKTVKAPAKTAKKKPAASSTASKTTGQKTTRKKQGDK